MKTTPLISIVIITWNSDKKLKVCLNYIAKQNFPKNKIEIVVVDGGSSDNTFETIKKQKEIFPHVKLFKTNIKDQEPKRAVGLLKSHGKYVCSIDPDVYLTDKNWLNTMVQPLEKDPSLTGSQTLYYTYTKKDALVNRYFALLGVNDPLVYYLGKADRVPRFEHTWLFNKNYIDCGNYFKVTFEESIPTMGCNGVIFRRATYLKANISPHDFFHIDVIADLVKKGYKNYAIVKNDVLHETADSFWHILQKRQQYMELHYFTRRQKRRYLVFDPISRKDIFNLVKFVFYTSTIVQPLYISIKGYLAVQDFAWFLHWPMCVSFLYIYTASTLKKTVLRR